MRTMRAAILLLSLVACDPAPAPDGAEAPPLPPPEEAGEAPPPAGSDRPQRTQFEGPEGTAGSTLIGAPRAFGIAFSTYLPADMRVEFRTAPAGDAVRFTYSPGRRPDRRAFAELFSYPEHTSQKLAREAVLGLAAGRISADSASIQPLDWADVVRALHFTDPEGTTHVGFIALGRHGGRAFHLLVEYPAELAAQMKPRVMHILRSWRWEDSGEPLDPR